MEILVGITLAVITGIVIYLLQEPVKKLIFGIADILLWIVCRVRGCGGEKARPGVLFTCRSEDARHAQEVYVAGDFNHWLGADKGFIHPTLREREQYGLEKRIVEEDQVIWEKEIWVTPGPHDFKFVIGHSHWIDWYEDCGYPQGSRVPDGSYNFAVIMELQSGLDDTGLDSE